jgi:hypothetical protein
VPPVALARHNCNKNLVTEACLVVAKETPTTCGQAFDELEQNVADADASDGPNAVPRGSANELTRRSDAKVTQVTPRRRNAVAEFLIVEILLHKVSLRGNVTVSPTQRTEKGHA